MVCTVNDISWCFLVVGPLNFTILAARGSLVALVPWLSCLCYQSHSPHSVFWRSSVVGPTVPHHVHVCYVTKNVQHQPQNTHTPIISTHLD